MHHVAKPLKPAAFLGPDAAPPVQSGVEAPKSWDAFSAAVLDVRNYLKVNRRIPSRVFLGPDSVAPSDFLVGLSDLAGNPIPSGAIGKFVIAIPAVPARPALLPSTDSGVSTSDGITSFNNSTAARALQFSVANTLPGATVTVYADGKAIGSAVATNSVTAVTTDGTTTILDGTHLITARQQAPGGAQTTDSPALSGPSRTIQPYRESHRRRGH